MLKYFLIVFFFLTTSHLFAQTDKLKAEAVKEMQAGRYGEAIDLLNRYLSANPQESEGYNLRGICYEKRNIFEMAVYDFRSARKLKPNNKEILTNLSRATDSWYKLIYNKIEGHKREIAINPNRINNYLEIGKSYKNLGEWLAAEEWYDKYLKMEEASSDEIIRYTEILAKNNHISKGEPILKRYTEKFPNDHRIWSRYGYFVMWLGKNNLAIMAFEKALELRPFFKEAMDGLDQAKGKGYIYLISDTTYKGGKGSQQQEYAIDRYYRQLKKEPANNSIRQDLIRELIKVQRFEEALTESNKLAASDDAQKYSLLINEVQEKRNNFIALKTAEFRKRFESNSKDYEAVLKLAEFYSRINDFDSASIFYTMYLEKYPDNLDVRYNFSKVLASNKDFTPAFENVNYLLAKSPDNLKYKLLKNQFYVWTGTNVDQAKQDLSLILQKEPGNIEALITFISANTQAKDFAAAEEYMQKLEKLSPGNDNISKLQNDIEFAKLRYEEERLYGILEEGRSLAMNGNCSEALSKYEEYLSKAAPNFLIKKEYGDVQGCAKNFDRAIEIYNEVLKEQYSLETDIEKSKAYYYKGDSVQALQEFSRLYKEKPDDFFVNLYLGDVYLQMRDFDNARDVYDRLNEGIIDSTIEADTTQISMLSLRYKWFPSSGDMFGTFGNTFALAPFTQFYKDNQDFMYSQTGARLEMSLTSFIGAGFSFSRTFVNTDSSSNTLNTFKGTIFLRLMDNLIFSGSTGATRSSNFESRKVTDAILRYEKQNVYSIYGSYEYNDGRIILFSPKLIDQNYSARIYRLGGYYIHPSGFKFSGYFHFIKVSDSNEGNQFTIRAGRKFYPDLFAGYEYDFQNFGFVSKLYYTPKNLESHSLWGEYKAYQEQNLDFTIGGKLGYIPSFDFTIGEVYGDLKYVPFSNFNLSGRAGFGSTYRDDTSYNSISISVSAYWSF